MSEMTATEEPATHVASGAPAGVGWMYLQPAQTTFTHYLHKQSIGLGAAQIVIGSLCIVFNAISLAIGGYFGLSVVGHGFWCGALFIVTGAIGISAGVSKTKCKVVSYMVLCIISAAFTTALLVCGILSAVIIGWGGSCRDYGYGYSYRYYYSSPCPVYTTSIAMEGCLAVCGFIAVILFIWGSVLSCKATPCCCCHTPGSFQQLPLPQYPANNGFQPFQVIHSTQYPLPTMPYQPGMPSGQPILTQTYALGAAAEPYSRPHPTQVFGGNSDYPPKY